MDFIATNFVPVMFIGLLLFLLMGFPVAFSLAATGLFFGFIGMEVGLFPSNLFQPATAQIGAIAGRLGIPAFNGLPSPVLKNEMLASYSIDYPAIGASAAGLVEKVFKGQKVSELPDLPPFETASVELGAAEDPLGPLDVDASTDGD